MSHVKAMVDYFDDLTMDKRLSMSSIIEERYQENDFDDDDELLSYDSDNENSKIVNAQGTPSVQYDEIPTILDTETMIEGHDLEYSSDDDDDDDDDGDDGDDGGDESGGGDGADDADNNSALQEPLTIMLSPQHHNEDILHASIATIDGHDLEYSSDDDDVDESRGGCGDGADDDDNNSTLEESLTIVLSPQRHQNEDILHASIATPKIKNIEQKNYNVDTINSFGQTPLMIASKNCHLDAVKLFVSEGSDVNLQDIYGHSPLHLACMNDSMWDRLSCINLLLEKGANVNAKDNQGSTALHKAAAIGCVSSIDTLLQYKACPNMQNIEGNLPLHEATMSQNTDAIKKLLEVKCCSDLCTCHKFNYGHHNITETKSETSSLKLETDKLPPPSAISLEIWKQFFANAADSNETYSDDSHDTVISLPDPFELDDPHIISDINDVYGFDDGINTSSLHNHIEVSDGVYTSSDLLSNGLDINERDEFGNTSLHIAATDGDLCLVSLLVKNGAKSNIKNLNNETPLSICLLRGHLKCARVLYDHERKNYIFNNEINDKHYQHTHLGGFAVYLFTLILSIFHRDSSKITNKSSLKVPDDVAAALVKAKSNNNVLVKQLEPPLELKHELIKAGLM